MIPLPLTIRGDIARLNQCMSVFARELGLAPADVVRTNAGLLAGELAEAAAPTSKQALERKIEKDVKRVYSPAPKQMLPIAHRSGRGFVWIMATPTAVIGAKSYDWHPLDTVDDMQRLFYRTEPRSGPKQVDLGKRKRGTQAVLQLNRVVVRRGVFREFLNALKKRAGILGGSWVVAWDVLRPGSRKPPAYKYRHVEQGTAKGSYIDGLGIPGHARFTLVNRAAGCENARQLEMVSGKLQDRAMRMMMDLRNQLRGAYKRAGFKKAN